MVLSWAGGSARGVCGGRVCRDGGSGGGVEGDGVSEGFELGDETAGFAFGVQAGGEVVGAELVVGLSVARMCQMMTTRAWATTTMAFFLAIWLR